MRFVSFEQIVDLNINSIQCVEWAAEAIRCKSEWILPEKNSIKFGDNCFFNTMPSLWPRKNIFGVKEVSRIPTRIPALKADILLYDVLGGDLKAFMDGTWITTMRTGAVAAISMKLLKKSDAKKICFIGLGNTARATLLCYEALCGGSTLDVSVLAYKNQHEDFIERFRTHKNIHFQVYDDVEEMIGTSDIVVSCVTATDCIFAPDNCYKKGVLVVPVHTRGFQNCDLFFDKIFCDDIAHISGFKYFKQYKFVSELTDIIPPPHILLHLEKSGEQTGSKGGIWNRKSAIRSKGGNQMMREFLPIILVFLYKTYILLQRFWNLWNIEKVCQRNFGCKRKIHTATFLCSCMWRNGA